MGLFQICRRLNRLLKRYRIHSVRSESTNAAIKRLQAKECRVSDVEHLLLKLRQIYFLWLQGRYKTPSTFYQQI